MNFISPKKSVNSAFLKLPVPFEKMEAFTASLKNLYKRRDENQDEEYHKGEIWSFLKKIFNPDYSVQVTNPIDLAIYNGNDTKAKPAVIIEMKSPSNTAEMFSKEHPNSKALQELVYYFMLEYIRRENREIKYLMISNFDEWYFFDVKDFIRYFAQKSNPIYDQFRKFTAQQMSGNKTSVFYKDIAKPAIDDFLANCEFSVVHFSLAEAAKAAEQSDEKKLIALYKFLSPETLLAKPFANDSNSLDKNFYAELLHIIGLEEVKDGGKKVIRRKQPKNRDKASLLESAIYQLEDDISDAEKCEAMALRLCITWVNRLLFLKLVESQILMYQKGDPAYRFMSLDKIGSFDELNIFFFKVLGKEIDARDEDVLKKYPNVPYLNSSLFEPTEDESRLKIRGIPDAQIEIFNKTVLKDEKGKRVKGTMQNLEYIFRFLDAYNFASDAQGGITNTNKTLINASVLGLIFEKINGYKDGSFYTPGFITDYMAKDVLERTVVQKFNEVKSWDCKDLEDVADKIDDVQDANLIVDSVRVADIAVGSGHFLVSALNRMLAIKSDLNIFCDTKGKRIKRADYRLKVDNDELSVVDEDNEPFEYKPGNEERQRIQEALFKEKKNIIENCLFGVDLNPNSVNICRLRLWIELLKNAYYTEESGFKRLETLPNIDINIKVGDSLLSKYPVQNNRVVLDFLQKGDKADKKSGLAARLKDYRENVQSYKKGGSAYDKRQLRLNINGLKAQLKEPPVVDLWGNVVQGGDIDFSNSLEWMFEFPEILDDEGKFVGFDAVIGNPPYVQLQSMGAMSDVYGERGYTCYNKSADLYCLFVERAHSFLKKNGYFSFIMPNKWMLVDYGKELRQFMSQVSLKKILNFGDIQFFADAATIVCIFVAQKSDTKTPVQACTLNSRNYFGDLKKEVNAALFELSPETFGEKEWSIRNKLHDSVLQKMNHGTPLREMPIAINYGLKTGYNEAFFIDEKTREKLIAEDPKSEELIKPLLRGRDVTAWVTEKDDQYMLFVPWHYPNHLNPLINGASEQSESEFKVQKPAIYNHLLGYKEQLSARNKAETGIRYEWYALQRWGADYYKEFAKPKIVYPNMTSVFPFSFDETGSLGNDKTFMITMRHSERCEESSDEFLKALLAIFNSNLCKLWIWYNCPELMGGTREIRKAYFENLRIPLDNKEILHQLAQLADQIITIKKFCAEGADSSAVETAQRNVATLENEVNTLVYKLYGDFSEEEIASVESR